MSTRNADHSKFHLTMEPLLTNRESNAMQDAINSAPLVDQLFTNVAGKVYWCLPSAPKHLRGRNFGVTDSLQEAKLAISTLLAVPTPTRLNV